jgi:putative Mg2+ transporter-C (MgtC) family protein
MSQDLELLLRLLLAAVLGGAIVRHGLTVKGVITAASIWATASVGVAIGAGSYVLGIGGAILVVGTLFGLRRVGTVLQRWGVSREEYLLETDPGFDVERIVELVQREKVDLRALERHEIDESTDVVLLVKLPPRYPPERLLDALGRLEGVRQVEWAPPGAGRRQGQPRPRRSGSSAGSQVRPTRNGPKRP